MQIEPVDEPLAALIEMVNALRRRLPPGATTPALLEVESELERESPASCRLATYGTLVPGAAHHELVAALEGRWHRALVRGLRFEGRCGSARGYPALRLSEDAGVVEVVVLESRALPLSWGRLDCFEGPGYRRMITPVWDRHGRARALANVYEAVEEPPIAERAMSS